MIITWACGLRGTKVGEASHPGPSSAAGDECGSSDSKCAGENQTGPTTTVACDGVERTSKNSGVRFPRNRAHEAPRAPKCDVYKKIEKGLTEPESMQERSTSGHDCMKRDKIDGDADDDNERDNDNDEGIQAAKDYPTNIWEPAEVADDWDQDRDDAGDDHCDPDSCRLESMDDDNRCGDPACFCATPHQRRVYADEKDIHTRGEMARFDDDEMQWRVELAEGDFRIYPSEVSDQPDEGHTIDNEGSADGDDEEAQLQQDQYNAEMLDRFDEEVTRWTIGLGGVDRSISPTAPFVINPEDQECYDEEQPPRKVFRREEGERTTAVPQIRNWQVGYAGIRVGEASHPGPAAATTTRRKREERRQRTASNNSLGGLGELIAQFKPIIAELIKQLVREAVASIVGGGNSDGMGNITDESKGQQVTFQNEGEKGAKKGGNPNGKGDKSENKNGKGNGTKRDKTPNGAKMGKKARAKDNAGEEKSKLARSRSRGR